MRSVNKDRGGKTTSTSAVNTVEFRILAIGNDAGERGKTASQKLGFIGAGGAPTNGVFVIQHPVITPGDSIRRKPFKVFACAGMEREVQKGTIVDMEPLQNDPTLFYFLVQAGTDMWLYICDRNPRLDVTSLGSLKGIGCEPPVYSLKFQLSESQGHHPYVPPPASKSTGLGAYTPPPRSKPVDHGAYRPPLTVLETNGNGARTPDLNAGSEQRMSDDGAELDISPAPRQRIVTPPPTPPTPLPPAAPAKPVPILPPPVSPKPPAAMPAKKVTVVVGVAATPPKPLPALPVSTERSIAILRLIKQALEAGEKRKVKVSEIRAFAATSAIPGFSGQPRTHFDPVEMQRLKDSIEIMGLLDPLLVIPVSGHPTIKWELVDGERRFRNVCSLNWTDVDVVVISIRDARHIKQAQHLMSLARNFCRQGHTPMEMSRAISQQLRAGMSQTELAKITGRTTGYISMVAGLERLVPELQVLADHPTPEVERIRFEPAKILSRIQPQYQLASWNEVKGLKHQRLILQRLKELSRGRMVHERRPRTRGVFRSIGRTVHGALASVESVGSLELPRLQAMLRGTEPETMERTLTEISTLEARLRVLRQAFEAARPRK